MKGGPLFPHLLFDGKIHVPPAVVHPKLQGLALKLDGPIVPAAEFEHVGHPVDGPEGALKVDLDHVPPLLVVDLVVDLVGEAQKLPEFGGVVFHGDVLHRVGGPPGMGIILAGVDEVLLVGEPSILHGERLFFLNLPILYHRPRFL